MGKTLGDHLPALVSCCWSCLVNSYSPWEKNAVWGQDDDGPAADGAQYDSEGDCVDNSTLIQQVGSRTVLRYFYVFSLSQTVTLSTVFSFWNSSLLCALQARSAARF